MKTLKNRALSGIVGLALAAGTTFAADIDTDAANVSMQIGLYAALTGLDDFVLTTSDIDGSAGATYSGSDDYNLESNGQVRVSLSGGSLSNGSTSLATSYAMDSSGVTFDTTVGAVHNQSHNVSASAVLGDISDQAAGSYASIITLTVSSL